MLLHFWRHETCLRPWVTTCAGTFLSNRLVFLSLLWHSSLFYNTNMAVSPHEEKMIGIQRQLRQNQQDLQDFLFDLGSWEDEMKRKEQELRKEKSDEPQVWHLKCIVLSNHYYMTLPNFLDNSFAFIWKLVLNDWLCDQKPAQNVLVRSTNHFNKFSSSSTRCRLFIWSNHIHHTHNSATVLYMSVFPCHQFCLFLVKVGYRGIFNLCNDIILDLERIHCRNHPSLVIIARGRGDESTGFRKLVCSANCRCKGISR